MYENSTCLNITYRIYSLNIEYIITYIQFYAIILINKFQEFIQFSLQNIKNRILKIEYWKEKIVISKILKRKFKVIFIHMRNVFLENQVWKFVGMY